MMLYDDLTEAFTATLHHVMRMGQVVSPRGMKTREVLFHQLGVRHPATLDMDARERKLRPVIGLIEGLQDVGQFSVPELLTDRVQHFADFTDDGIMYGAYGSRLHGQLESIVSNLKSDESSRQAVMTVFDGHRDVGRVTRDVPCTLSLQFLLRDDLLQMRVTMRSNDAWLGLPYDLMQFAIVQATVAQALDCEPGEYVHTSGSLHIYERDWEKVSSVWPGKYSDDFFPLWDDGASYAAQARDLAFGRRRPSTQFGRWADDILQAEKEALRGGS